MGSFIRESEGFPRKTRHCFPGQLSPRDRDIIQVKLCSDKARRAHVRPPAKHRLHAGALRWPLPWLAGNAAPQQVWGGCLGDWLSLHQQLCSGRTPFSF